MNSYLRLYYTLVDIYAIYYRTMKGLAFERLSLNLVKQELTSCARPDKITLAFKLKNAFNSTRTRVKATTEPKQIIYQFVLKLRSSGV